MLKAFIGKLKESVKDNRRQRMRSKILRNSKWSTSSILGAQQSTHFGYFPMFLSFCTVLSNKGKMPPKKSSLSYSCQGTLYVTDVFCYSLWYM